MPDEQYKAILPKPTQASAPFWEGCDREELLLPSCRPCGHVFYYPRIACPSCGKAMGTWKLHKVEIDRCEPHGIWFDRDELEHVLFATFVPAS